MTENVQIRHALGLVWLSIVLSPLQASVNTLRFADHKFVVALKQNLSTSRMLGVAITEGNILANVHLSHDLRQNWTIFD